MLEERIMQTLISLIPQLYNGTRITAPPVITVGSPSIQ